ncbi:MAG TPA: HD domain-containing protein, partial [Candidatus Portnoybacteria bacterium]|nr:HD domain-containing protein [Candidatus Portnoybacteria bacterium]
MTDQSLTKYSLDGLLKKLKNKKAPVDFDLIKRAYCYAENAHRGQKRSSGEDYIFHPLRATYHLADLTTDSITLAAELLHDVVDDTPITNEEIKKEFGQEIAFLVGGVTKLGKIKYRGIEREIENLRKIFLAMAEDLRVVLIKLCDRWDNLETLSALPERKQKRIALETLEIYTPL